MRFASLGGSNAGKYAAAGKAASNSYSKVLTAQLKSRPDHAGLNIVAMNTASDIRIAGMKAEKDLTNVAQKVYAGQKRDEIDIDLFNKKSEINTGLRKAGGIAAAGRMLGAGYLAASDSTKGRERPKADLLGLFNMNKAKRDSLKKSHEAALEAHGTFSAEPYKPSTVTGAANLKSSETGQAYMKMLTESGMSKPQAAALVGHLKVESDNFQADEEYAPNAYGTRGRGHLQWTNTDNSKRRDNFEAFAASKGLSPTSFEANSSFLLSEMKGNHGQHWTNDGSMDGFLQTQNIDDASSYLQSNFIRPGVPHTERRLQGAYAAFDAFQ